MIGITGTDKHGRPATYLGDAVYAIYDEEMDGVILRLNHHENKKVEIYLEKPVIDQLNKFFLLYCRKLNDN